MFDQHLISFLEHELRYPIAVTNDGCWCFTGGSKNGFHGSLYYKGISWQAHRLSFAITNDPIPEGLNVLHSCDVGMCIRPTHLFLGTQTDNITDMDTKGRSNRPQPGEKNGRAFLTEQDVITIRLKHKQGVIPLDLANEYKLGRTYIYKILTRTTWRHI